MLANAEYYRQGAKSTGDSVHLVAQVDRSSIADHQRVVTPTDSSAATHKVTVAPPSGGSRRSMGYSASPVNNTTSAASAPSTFSDPPTRTLPQPPPKVNVKQARAIYDFNAQEDNEVGFKAGDVLTIHNTRGDWWEGELNGKRGLLPSNYVQLID